MASPKLPLHRDKVLNAAIQFSNEHGLEALSMRKLADKLGVKAMSLYNHVSNKDDIIDGMVEIVAKQLQLDAEWKSGKAQWKTCMLQRANKAYDVLKQNPWATQAIVSRANTGPFMLHYVDDTLGCLNEAGFSIVDADHVWNVMDNYIYGYILQELNFPFTPDEYRSAAQDYVDMIPESEFPYLNKLTQEVMHGRYDGLHNFQFGFTLLLDGLERFLSSQS